MQALIHLLQMDKEQDDQPPDASDIAAGLERRKKFLRYLNRGWLILGVVSLVTSPLFPNLRGEFSFITAATFSSYLIVRFLNLSGKTRFAGVVFTLCVNFGFYGVFLVLVGQIGAVAAFQTQATVWFLMGLAVLFAGAIVDKWAAPGLAAFNTVLLIGTRYSIAPEADPRPSAVVFWWMLALTIWLYEHTLSQALAQVLSDLKERKRAEDEIRSRAEMMTALYETTHDLVIERDLSKLLQTIVERAVQLLNATGGGLYLSEPDRGQVRCVVSHNTPSDFTGTVLRFGEGAAGLVAQTGEPLIIDDYSAWQGRAKVYEQESPFNAVLSVPMKWQGEVTGVIHVLEYGKERYFTEDDRNLVASFADQAAIAVQNARLYLLNQQELAERKTAEAALLDSEQRFRDLSDAAFEGILIHDMGIIQDANQVFADLVGYRSPEALIGKNGFEILPFTSESLERLRTSPNSGLAGPLEITVIRPDGSTYPAETQGRDITFKDRKLRVVAMRDITARKQAEEQLRKLSRAVEQSPASIIITSRAGEIEYVNPKFTKVTGYTMEEALGKNPRILKSGYTNPADYKQLWDTITSGREWLGEFHNQKKNGELYWEYAVISSISNDRGEITHFVAVKEDITERKQAEEARRASEKQYRSLFENMLEGYAYCQMLFVDSVPQDFIYLDVNPSFQSLTGLRDIIGQKVSEVIPGIKGTNPELFDIYGRVALTGQPESFETYVPALKIWFSMSVFSPAREYFVAVFENITKRKQVEGEREKLIAELTAKNAELERFTYTVSHDLKSPLVTIMGFLGYLEQDAISGDVARLKDDTQRIASAVEKMQDLLNDLLELSRIGRFVSPPELVPFEELARSAIELVHGRLAERGVSVKLEPDLPVVYGDRQRLMEVLQNLLDNAAKYLGHQPKPLIEIGQQGVLEGYPCFYVKDNGVGIAPEYREKIFGLFNKLDPRSEGTGIGLALVKRIIEFHGGQIWVESESGHGSTFFFTLPAAP
jgi:PAS domain S-box